MAGRQSPGVSLTLADQPPVERADAARNRQKILDAAQRLAAGQGLDSLSMDGVARAAGVGVGTVYRRFGDRAGLVMALIDQHERSFQAAFLHGPPPLGPGAPARVRIIAFLAGLVERIDRQGEYMLVAETNAPFSRYTHAYALHHAHLCALLAEASPGADATWLADALLAPVAANLVIYERTARGMSVERIQAGIESLLDAALPPTGGGGPDPGSGSDSDSG